MRPSSPVPSVQQASGRRVPTGSPVRVVGVLTLVGAAFLVGAALATPLAAQIPSGWAVEGGASYELYSFGDAGASDVESLSLVTLPVTAEVRLGRRTTVRLSGRYAHGTMTRADGRTASLSGPTDTDLRVVVPFADDAVVLTGLVSAPTGRASHGPDEAEVAGAIAADLLPFRITNWGTGGGVGASVALARPFGPYGVGVSAGYVVSGDFEPREGREVRYEPGNMLRVNGVVDRSVGDSKLSARVSYQRYSEDALGGANLFRAGDRLEALGTVSFPVSRSASAMVYGGVLHREKGSFLRDTRTAPAQDLWLLGAGLRLPFRGGTVTPVARARVFRSDAAEGSGFTTELRATGRWLTDGGLAWGPVVGLRLGSVDVRADRSSGFLGAELGLSVGLGSTPASAPAVPGGPGTTTGGP